jgi:hypothetical protein
MKMGPLNVACGQGETADFVFHGFSGSSCDFKDFSWIFKDWQSRKSAVSHLPVTLHVKNIFHCN